MGPNKDCRPHEGEQAMASVGIDRGSLKCQVALEVELKQAGAKQAFAPACFPNNQQHPGAALG